MQHNMNIDWSALLGILKAVGLLFVGAWVTRIFEKRPKLTTYYGHVLAFKATPPQGGRIDVFSHSVILRNSGKTQATNVRLHHTTLPDFNIWPGIVHNVETLPDGTRDIVIPSLIPNEQITISYLYFPPLTYSQINAGIKSDQGFAQQVEALLQPKTPKWLTILVLIFMTVGFVALLYLIIIGFERLITH